MLLVDSFPFFIFMLVLLSATYYRRKRLGGGEIDRASLQADYYRVGALFLLVSLPLLVIYVLGLALHWH